MNAVVNGSLAMLLIEDNPADVVFFNEAMEATQTPSAVHAVGDGDKALQFLRRQRPFADAPRPDVIVLDLNLPIKNSQEVMMKLASDPALNAIPVAILTTSTSETCVCEIYPSGRCLYFTKTDDFKRLQDIVRQIAAHARVAYRPSRLQEDRGTSRRANLGRFEGWRGFDVLLHDFLRQMKFSRRSPQTTPAGRGLSAR